jgi:hypothetical protein
MDAVRLRAIALAALGDLAPEADLSALVGGDPIQDTLDIDSFDFLRFVQALYDATGVDIPESDYGAIATLDGVVSYLQRSAAGAS